MIKRITNKDPDVSYRSLILIASIYFVIISKHSAYLAVSVSRLRKNNLKITIRDSIRIEYSYSLFL